ncbi:protein VACUOLELESS GAMETOPHYTES-like [Salvia miltiorrhiza]|uniref:protein VACUOLELESS GAMETOPHYTES-like n=1 Tax=Salvia miltiorrhiza TaxID=226208 RepID=UPI0025AB8387|nr:protein VACUOLELESS GAMETOPHYTES-like [Salvia miltiorrhiza]
MAAPSTTNHASHGQHLLFRTNRLSAATPLTYCPNDSLLYDVYRCIVCDYYIHISCAMLPKRIVFHEYHQHPLHLLFTATTTREYFCEKDIDLKYWMYGCAECKQWFHINCIPSLGYLSKVKFGGTISIPDCHIHDLILTRMLTLPSQRCGHCKQTIQGLQDEMALFCSHCHFWLHFSCARNSLAL